MPLAALASHWLSDAGTKTWPDAPVGNKSKGPSSLSYRALSRDSPHKPTFSQLVQSQVCLQSTHNNSLSRGGGGGGEKRPITERKKLSFIARNRRLGSRTTLNKIPLVDSTLPVTKDSHIFSFDNYNSLVKCILLSPFYNLNIWESRLNSMIYGELFSPTLKIPPLTHWLSLKLYGLSDSYRRVKEMSINFFSVNYVTFPTVSER